MLATFYLLFCQMDFKMCSNDVRVREEMRIQSKQIKGGFGIVNLNSNFANKTTLL